MKRYILILFACFNVLAYGQNNIIKTLNQSYKLGFVVKSPDTIRYQRTFFNTFPSNFKSFENTYGWNRKSDKAGPLSDVSLEHINHFFNLRCIGENIFISKIVHIQLMALGMQMGLISFYIILDYISLDTTLALFKF